MTDGTRAIPSEARRVLIDVLRPGVLRHSVAFFLGALSVMFVTSPFVEEMSQGDLAESVALSIVMLLALLAVGGRRWTLGVAAALLTPALALKWIHHVRPGFLPEEVQHIASIVFVLFVTACLFRYIVAARRIDSETLCAGIAVYLMIGLVWSMAYTLLACVSPNAFQFTLAGDAGKRMEGYTALYFSFTTLTSVGFGDIVPVKPAARMLAMTEAVSGVFYLAVMVSRLVSLYASGKGEAVDPV